MTIVLDIEETLHPLQELEIVLILSLNELVNVDVALDVVFQKDLLQNLIVFDIFVVVLCIPSDLSHWDCARVASVDDLAIHGSCCALLNLC